MPKLDPNLAKDVDEQEVREFTALEPGDYYARLESVDVAMAAGKTTPYWKWTFKLVDFPGKQWVNTSLMPDALWKLKEVFAAFNATPDTDTDELIGNTVILRLTKKVQTVGANKGNNVNEVAKVLPADEADARDDDEASAWDA